MWGFLQKLVHCTRGDFFLYKIYKKISSCDCTLKRPIQITILLEIQFNPTPKHWIELVCSPPILQNLHGINQIRQTLQASKFLEQSPSQYSNWISGILLQCNSFHRLLIGRIQFGSMKTIVHSGIQILDPSKYLLSITVYG